MKNNLFIILIALCLVAAAKNKGYNGKKATTHSIFPQIQKEIAKMHLPKSFFVNTHLKKVNRILK